jgi:hypothetical protein
MAEEMKPRLAELIKSGEIHRSLHLWQAPYALLQLLYQDCSREVIAYFLGQDGPRTEEEIIANFEDTCIDRGLIKLLLKSEAGKLVFKESPEGYSMRDCQVLMLADLVAQIPKLKIYMKIDGD